MKKKKERVNDFNYCKSRLYYLRTSPTFVEYLKRCDELRSSEEFKRLTVYHLGQLEVMMRQCSPSLAIDYSTGIQGWGNAIVSAYWVTFEYNDFWAVRNTEPYWGEEHSHKLYHQNGKFVRYYPSHEVYDQIHKRNLQVKTIWLNCPFRKDLNGKEY